MRTVPSRRVLRGRRGFTLAELILTITLTVAVFSAAVPFFTMQLRQLQQDLGRTDAQQTARYAQNTVDRELRNIGIGVTPMDASQGILRNQPKIVQAHGMAVTFNTDLVANDTLDLEAVYFDPNVPVALTLTMSTSTPITLPLASKTYPDFTYRKPDGSLSLAETLSYWASLDSTAGVPNEYIIWRRVNNGPVTLVARGINIPAGQSLFQYTRVDSAGSIVTIPSGQLPLYWDTSGGRADSIRTVTLNVKGVFRGYNLQNKATTYTRSVVSQTALANIGLAQRTSCGDVPLNPGTPVAALVMIGGVTRVQVTWTASNDEASGEKDVQRYVLFRRIVGTGWAAPINQVGGSRSASYMWEDFDMQSGVSFEYGVVAQDCSPANSAMRTSSAVLHP